MAKQWTGTPDWLAALQKTKRRSARPPQGMIPKGPPPPAPEPDDAQEPFPPSIDEAFGKALRDKKLIGRFQAMASSVGRRFADLRAPVPEPAPDDVTMEPMEEDAAAMPAEPVEPVPDFYEAAAYEESDESEPEEPVHEVDYGVGPDAICGVQEDGGNPAYQDSGESVTVDDMDCNGPFGSCTDDGDGYGYNDGSGDFVRSDPSKIVVALPFDGIPYAEPRTVTIDFGLSYGTAERRLAMLASVDASVGRQADKVPARRNKRNKRSRR